MIDSMIDLTIEIEGLLRIIRDGNPPAETFSLLKRKISSLAEQTAELDKRSHAEEKNAQSGNEEPLFHLREDSDADDIVFSLDDDEDNYHADKEYADNIPNGNQDRKASAPQQKQKKNLRSRFSLNDRFLYSRELFDGNMKTFDATIASLEGTDNFLDIEEYFYNELDWDREDSNVASFMEILKAAF